MANDSSIRGLFPITGPTGNIQVTYYRANTALAIYRYQPVALNNSGQVAQVAVGQNLPLLGSVVGFLDLNHAGLPSGITSLSAGAYLPASTDAWVGVTDSPAQRYLIEEDTGGSALTTSEIGNTADFTYIDAGTGNTTTGYSYAVLDRSTAAAGTGGALQILYPQDKVNQDGTLNSPGNYCEWVVRIANHQLGNTKVGVSV
jgi:hypothetical protein